MVEHLRSTALLLRTLRHKNCRIGELLFDGLNNSTPNSLLPWIQQKKYYICSILGKRILLADKSGNHVLYHITSQILQLVQHVSLSFSEGAAEKLRVVLQCIFRSDFLFLCTRNRKSENLQWLWVLKTIPAPACLVALMIWHSCYRAQTFEV